MEVDKLWRRTFHEKFRPISFVACWNLRGVFSNFFWYNAADFKPEFKFKWVWIWREFEIWRSAPGKTQWKGPGKNCFRAKVPGCQAAQRLKWPLSVSAFSVSAFSVAAYVAAYWSYSLAAEFATSFRARTQLQTLPQHNSKATRAGALRWTQLVDRLSALHGKPISTISHLLKFQPTKVCEQRLAPQLMNNKIPFGFKP